ncbi:UNVERIFIED_ORG: hypothetical protein FHR35_006980 [Microbispora rosea subsp. rosea]
MPLGTRHRDVGQAGYAAADRSTRLWFTRTPGLAQFGGERGLPWV